jgi:hypothetical protein
MSTFKEEAENTEAEITDDNRMLSGEVPTAHLLAKWQTGKKVKESKG